MMKTNKDEFNSVWHLPEGLPSGLGKDGSLSDESSHELERSRSPEEEDEEVENEEYDEDENVEYDEDENEEEPSLSDTSQTYFDSSNSDCKLQTTQTKTSFGPTKACDSDELFNGQAHGG
eukprot:Selendium_serpulae@DN5078_c0_g1_i1.p1